VGITDIIVSSLISVFMTCVGAVGVRVAFITGIAFRGFIIRILYKESKRHLYSKKNDNYAGSTDSPFRRMIFQELGNQIACRPTVVEFTKVFVFFLHL
jgi:hypothetical protein